MKKSDHSEGRSAGSLSSRSGEGDVKNWLSLMINVAFSHTNSCTQGFHRLLTFSLETYGRFKPSQGFNFKREKKEMFTASEEQLYSVPHLQPGQHGAEQEVPVAAAQNCGTVSHQPGQETHDLHREVELLRRYFRQVAEETQKLVNIQT